MDAIVLTLEALVVIGAIAMGTRSSGVALGLWGGLGVAVLVFVFGEDPGSPPVDAVFIILSVILAASMMQASGGIDWMVGVATRLMSRSPKRIVMVAPLVCFLFCAGAGTGNIIYPLLPVIYDLSYRAGIRPARALALSVVSSGIALAASPVSAAMAAMVTLTDVAPYDVDMVKILAITLPAGIVGIVVASFGVSRLGPELADDPEYQRRLREGVLDEPDLAAAAPAAGSSGEAGDEAALEPPASSTGRSAALLFLGGVAVIVLFGLFPALLPEVGAGDDTHPMSMTLVIEMVMFTVGTLILLVCKTKTADVPTLSVFKAGMVSAIALFGLAWLTDTFISAHKEQIVDTIGGWVNSVTVIYALALLLIASLTTSQSTATRTIVPIGLASGLSPGLVVGMWLAIGGVSTLPANGSQIAAANFDRTGSTTLGTKLYDHSFFVPQFMMLIPAVITGALLGLVII